MFARNKSTYIYDFFKLGGLFAKCKQKLSFGGKIKSTLSISLYM